MRDRSLWLAAILLLGASPAAGRDAPFVGEPATLFIARAVDYVVVASGNVSGQYVLKGTKATKPEQPDNNADLDRDLDDLLKRLRDPKFFEEKK